MHSIPAGPPHVPEPEPTRSFSRCSRSCSPSPVTYYSRTRHAHYFEAVCLKKEGTPSR
jgi:hypothetical protein